MYIIEEEGVKTERHSLNVLVTFRCLDQTHSSCACKWGNLNEKKALHFILIPQEICWGWIENYLFCLMTFFPYSHLRYRLLRSELWYS
jgi:hypothetical protein